MAVRIALSALAASFFALSGAHGQEGPDTREKAAAVSEEDGKYFDAEGVPTFNIQDDGTVDWYTFSGYRRYHGECHVCHGPDGVGSTYAPALVDSLKRLDYGTFLQIVAAGRTNGDSVMPAFGDNKNVYCYMDDIYVYLRARAVGGIPRGRPPQKEDKPESAREYEASCMEG